MGKSENSVVEPEKVNISELIELHNDYKTLYGNNEWLSRYIKLLILLRK